MNFVFLLEFGAEVGLGHLARSSRYAKALSDLGHQTTLLTTSRVVTLPLIDKFTNCFNHLAQVKSKDFGDDAHLLAIKNHMMGQGQDFLFIDSYQLSPQSVKKFHELGARTLQLADAPAKVDTTYILDYGFDAAPEKHSDSRTNGMFLGPDYSPISSVPGRISPFNHESPFILVSLGGGQRSKVLLEVAGHLLKIAPNHQIKLMTHYPTDALIDWAASRPRVSLLDAGAAFEIEANGADLLVVSAGVTFYEAISLGTPSVGIILADNQIAAASAVPKIASLSVVSLEGFLRSSLHDLPLALGVKTNRLSTSLELSSIVDNLGPARLAAHLVGILPTDLRLRATNESDLRITFKWANDDQLRLQSFGRAIIAAEDHIHWFNQLSSRGSRLFIGEVHGVPVGQLRLDEQDSEVRISYSIDPKFRKMGLAKPLIVQGLKIAAIKKTVVAEVNPENFLSLKILQSVGFKYFGDSDRGGLLLKLG